MIAQAAIKAAQTPEQLAAALATAPPTVKANHYNQLGNTLSDVAAKEKQTFGAAIPTYEAKLSAKTPPAPTLKSLDKTQIDKAPPTATPAPTPELTAQPQQAEPFTSDPAVLTTVNKLPEQPSPQRAEALEKTLESVQTTDPEALAKFSDRPTVPQQGDSDPQLVQKQSEAQTQNAQAAKADAAKEVLNGPGPEKVKPRTVNQKAEIGELKQLEVQQPEPVAGIDDFQQMQLPVEVQTAFDQKHQETMQSSLESSKQKLAETTQKRDADRQEKVVATKESVKAENAKAHKEQQDLVKTSQRNIQQQRLETMTHQKSELKRVSADIKDRKESENKAIGDRIQTDEGKVKTHYGQEEAKAKKQVEKGEKAAEEKKKKAKEKAKNEGWFSQAVNFLKERFNDLTKAIKGVFDIVRKAVNKILDAAQKFAIGLINKAAKWVKAQIKKFASFAKGLVDGLLKKHFPKLAKVLNKKIDELANKANKLVDQTALKLKKGVKNAVKGLRKGINAVLDTFEKGLNAAIAFMQAAFAGDWKAVLKMALEAVLAVIGIKPEEFYKFAGRAENTFKAIINNPLGFAKNLVEAFLLGMKNFSGKFLKYLKAGIIGWLTGTLGSAGIEIPKKFDLLGVLDLVRQVAGITFELLKKKATKLIGAKNVERVEFVVGQIKSLVEKGWDGFLKEIKESFTGLKEQVMSGIRDFLVTKIVISAVTKLASLFNPAGAIVQLVLTMWNLYTFVRDQLGRMMEMVKAVVGSVEKIAKKEFKPAAKKVEEVLANFLPLAIDLLAKVLGLGGVSKKVRDILKKVQKRIDKAIDRLLVKLARSKKKPAKKQSEEKTHRKIISRALAKINQLDVGNTVEEILNGKLKLAKKLTNEGQKQLKRGIKFTIKANKKDDIKKKKKIIWTGRIAPNASQESTEDPISATSPFKVFKPEKALKIVSLVENKKGKLAKRTRKKLYQTSYVANIIGLPSQSALKIATAYKTQTFKSTQEAHKRFSLVIMVNLYSSIDENKNEKPVKEAVAEATSNWNHYPFGAIGLNWEPNWKDSEGKSVSMMELRKAFRSLSEDSRQAVLDEEKTIGPKRKVPYGQLRDYVKNHQYTKDFIGALRRRSKDVYIHVGDADIINLKAPSSKMRRGIKKRVVVAPLFSRYDKILQQHKKKGIDPAVVSGGYDFRFKGDLSEEDSVNAALTSLGNQLDQAVREGVSKLNPLATYFPEPNTLVKVERDQETINASFGIADNEGRTFIANLVKERNAKNKEIIYDTRASIASDSERFTVRVDPGDGEGAQNITYEAKYYGGSLTAIKMEQLHGLVKQLQNHADSNAMERELKRNYFIPYQNNEDRKVNGVRDTRFSKDVRIIYKAIYIHRVLAKDKGSWNEFAILSKDERRQKIDNFSPAQKWGNLEVPIERLRKVGTGIDPTTGKKNTSRYGEMKQILLKGAEVVKTFMAKLFG
ncbi:MAG: hypothetical protein AAFQ95_21255 [Cyanobacteria bacterium J06621_3]